LNCIDIYFSGAKNRSIIHMIQLINFSMRRAASQCTNPQTLNLAKCIVLIFNYLPLINLIAVGFIFPKWDMTSLCQPMLKFMSCFTGKCWMGTQEQSSWENAWMWTWCSCCYAVGICQDSSGASWWVKGWLNFFFVSHEAKWNC
jgi:hypothetical protein